MVQALVLIVEDDETLTDAIARNLRARGYAISCAGSVAEATAAVHEQLPALVLLDIDLPDGSGWAVARHVREAKSTVPIVIVSAMQPNTRLCSELGIVGTLEKPFPLQSLLRLVAAHTSGAARA
jgi:DNA-binding response OmpR family regulator